tara:strand:+ start:1849 stop:2385 length:537 start_codon:yes stop_codon:yes gene_type:complete
MKATTKTILSRLSSGKMERQEAALALSAIIAQLRKDQHRLLYSGECQKKGQLESILSQMEEALRARRDLIEGGVFVTTITGARIKALFSMFLPLYIRDGVGNVISVSQGGCYELIEYNILLEKRGREREDDLTSTQVRTMSFLMGFGQPHHSIVGSNVLLLTINEGGFGGMDIEVKEI